MTRRIFRKAHVHIGYRGRIVLLLAIAFVCYSALTTGLLYANNEKGDRPTTQRKVVDVKIPPLDAEDLSGTTGETVVIAHTPLTNAIGVALNQTITISYDFPIHAHSVSSATIAAHTAYGGLLTGTFSVDGNTITLDPPRDFFAGEQVQVITTGQILGFGNTGGRPTQWGFTAGSKTSRCVAGFTEVNMGLPNLSGNAAWGDYDNNGGLDLLLTGWDGTNRVTKLYRNDNGTLAETTTSLLALSGNAAWGDYDNDGDLDLFLAGYDGTNTVSKLYRNDSGNLVDAAANLHSISGSAVWADFDNGGSLNLLLVGADNSATPTTKIYRNYGGRLLDSHIELNNVFAAGVAWGDYDTDGDLDLLLTGSDIFSTPMTRFYRNDNGSLVEKTDSGLPDIYAGSVTWADYDNDGDLDLLLTGDISSDPESPSPATQLFRNHLGAFQEVEDGFIDLSSSNAAWGDYDNDGDLDLLLSGIDVDNNRVTKLYQNNNGGFQEITAGLTAIMGSSGSVTWGDYDNDGDLDLLLTGADNSRTPMTKLYRNDDCPTITVTAAPARVAEDGAEQLVYTFARNDVSTAELSVNFAVGGTATFATDYNQSGAASFNATTGTVRFAANQVSTNVQIKPVADTLQETDETVVLTLTAGTGYQVGNPATATGTIAASSSCDLDNLTVTDEASLNWAIRCTNNAPAGKYTIRIMEDIVLTKDTEAFGAAQSTQITVQGNDHTIDGNSSDTVWNVPLTIYGRVALENLVITGGKTQGGGGVFVAESGELSIHNSIIRGNHSAEYGGGIRNWGTLAITQSMIEDNQATLGGGIDNEGTLTVHNSTIRNNRGSGKGGGIHNSGSLTIINSTISGNQVPIAGETDGGGAIYMTSADAKATIINSTIAHNNAGATGRDGIWLVEGELTVQNTIVANNGDAATGNANCTIDGGTLTSRGHNIAGDDSCGLNQTGDQPNTDPKLGPLADNGGSTLTHAPLTGSPAIDAGENSAVTDITTDQRGDGFPRIQGARVDIGAVEALPGTLRIRVETTPADATTDFAFTGNIPGHESFTLRHGGTQTLEQLAAASYQVTLQLPAGWVPSAPSCTDPTNNSQVDAANNRVSPQVDPGETVLCTFQLAQVALTIDTRINDQPADKSTDNDVPLVQPGAELSWSYLVRNNGAAALPADKLQVTANQADATPVRDTTTDTGNDGILSPGESWRYAATSTAQDLSQLDASATVEGCAPAGSTALRRALANTGTVQAYGVIATDAAHYCNPATVVGSSDEGGSVTVALPSGGMLTIDMPAGTVDTPTELTFTPTALNPVPTQDGFIFLLQAFTLVARQNGQLQENFIFAKPIVITIDYTEEYENAVDDEEAWTLLFFDTDTSEWSFDGITVLKRDTEKNQLVVQIEHLTQFALFAEEAPTHQAMVGQTICWGVDLDLRIDLPGENGRQLLPDRVPNTTIDLVVVIGDAPAYLQIRADATCVPYTGFHSMIDRTNELLSQNCVDGALCNRVQRIIFATSGSYTINTVTVEETVYDIYVPLLHKSCDGALVCG